MATSVKKASKKATAAANGARVDRDAVKGSTLLQANVIGHDQVMTRLLIAGRLHRLAPTLLFSGLAGIGKKLCAEALAQALICERAETPSSDDLEVKSEMKRACGECGPCLRVAIGQSESILNIAPDGASIKIEQVRSILEFCSLQKLGRAQVVIIDQAHLLNLQAANALLKSLEEPPEGTYFILVSANSAALLPTIRSRAQLIRFKPLSTSELKAVLVSGRIGIKDTDDSLLRASGGSVAEALKLLSHREEVLNIEAAALRFVKRSQSEWPAEEISELRDLIKDKTLLPLLASAIQRCFLDALRTQGGLSAMDPSRSPELVAGLAAYLQRDLHKLAEATVRMENEFTRNLDRGLILENFAIQIRTASRKQTGEVLQ